MDIKSIALAAVLAASSTLAVAQPSQGKGGSDNGPTSNAPSTPGTMKQSGAGGEMKKDSTMPSGKDASTQGAGTAGAANKKGDAASPGGMMKK